MKGVNIMKLTNIDFSNIKNKLEGIWNALESFAIAHKEILINIFITSNLPANPTKCKKT